MKFGELLRQKKDALGMSEAKLAQASGVKLGALHGYLLPPGSQGHRMPSFENVVKLAKALGTTCEAFAECEDIGDQVAAEKEAKPKKAAPKKAKK